MSTFRKKPVEVEAWRVPTDTGDITAYLDAGIRLAEWCGGKCHLMVEDDERAYEGCEVVGPHISIVTLEGTHAARPGDWIIQGVEDEFYPCKPAIFEATYEPVSAREGER